MPIEIFEDTVWQMSLGERAAVEGVLAQLKPSLAVEIGSAEGACLRRIAAHATEVHSFDLQPPALEVPANVTTHTGNSHELLPAFLKQLAEQGRNVEFAIVDGDHSPEGVRRDLEDLLDSTAVAQTVILIHDTVNERVRSGLDSVPFAAWPKVVHAELDWVPGQLFAEPALRNELWYGLGLVLVDSSHLAYRNGSVYEQRYHPAAPLLAEMRELVVARELAPAGADPDPRLEIASLRRRLVKSDAALRVSRAQEAALQTAMADLDAAVAAREAELAALRERMARAERALDDIKGSASWKATEPLRTAKRRVSRRKA